MRFRGLSLRQHRIWTLASLVALPACGGEEPAWLLRVENERPPWAIRGSIVNDSGAEDGWVVFHRGVIVSVVTDESAVPRKARRLRYDGYIYPGLIDTHNHPHYNAIARWSPPRTYGNRYEWMEDEEYKLHVQSVYDSLKEAGLGPAALKYGEVRALLGGTTAVQGTYVPEEAGVLVRNLGPAYGISAYTPDVRKLSSADVKAMVEGLRYGSVRRCFFHLAEGTDAGSREEFEELRRRGLLRSGVALIHGVGLERAHFREMAARGMFLVWSPRSNLTLYGKTADVKAAIDEGVVVALAPDWTLTGSDNVLEEMKSARDLSRKELGGAISPRDLFAMATSSAAKVAGVDGFLGKVAPRFAADLFLAPKLDEDPFESLLGTHPRHVHLVFVDGKPIYGDLERMRELVAPALVDPILVDGAEKGIVVAGDLAATPGADERWREIRGTLESRMDALAPLIEE